MNQKRVFDGSEDREHGTEKRKVIRERKLMEEGLCVFCKGGCEWIIVRVVQKRSIRK